MPSTSQGAISISPEKSRSNKARRMHKNRKSKEAKRLLQRSKQMVRGIYTGDSSKSPQNRVKSPRVLRSRSNMNSMNENLNSSGNGKTNQNGTDSDVECIQTKSPTTLRISKKNRKKSLRKQSFRKIMDTNKSFRRSKQFVHDDLGPSSQNQLTPSRTLQSNGKVKAKNKSLNTSTHDKSKGKDDDSDDDCVLLEPHVSQITILDDDDTNDENMLSLTDATTPAYHSLMQSFCKRSSSTPQPKNKKNMVLNPYFVDVAENRFLGDVQYEATAAPMHTKSENAEDDVVNLVDDTTMNAQNSTLKSTNNPHTSDIESSSEEEGEINETAVDDSIVFVSETNLNDFISINNNNSASGNFKKTNKKPVAPNNPPLYSDLFNRNEQRQLQAYNTNAYNPNAGEVLTAKKRMVLIDGSNVAFKHSLDREFSVKGLKIALDYFEKLGHDVKAIIPQFRMNFTKSTDPQELDKMHKCGKIVQTPCKNLPGIQSISYDDRFVLQLASELDAAVISNDNYRDLMHENPAFKKIVESRVIGFTWCNDIFILPKDPYGKWGPTLDEILNRF